jgi:hypothetical protein
MKGRTSVPIKHTYVPRAPLDPLRLILWRLGAQYLRPDLALARARGRHFWFGDGIVALIDSSSANCYE